ASPSLHGSIAKRPPFPHRPCDPQDHAVLARVSPGYPPHRVRLLTCYSPVRRSARHPKAPSSHDLHVLGTPPAFVLSQDQTLQRKFDTSSKRTLRSAFGITFVDPLALSRRPV